MLVGQVLEGIRGRHLGRDRGQVGRGGACGPPLGPTEVGAADHADLAGAPGLRGDPLDQVVAVESVERSERIPFAFRIVPPACVCRDDHIAAFGEPGRGFALAVVVVRRVGENAGVRAGRSARGVDVDGEAGAVAHGDEDAARDVDFVLGAGVVAGVGGLGVDGAGSDGDGERDQRHTATM